jgi:hypothetical protein
MHTTCTLYCVSAVLDEATRNRSTRVERGQPEPRPQRSDHLPLLSSVLAQRYLGSHQGAARIVLLRSSVSDLGPSPLPSLFSPSGLAALSHGRAPCSRRPAWRAVPCYLVGALPRVCGGLSSVAAEVDPLVCALSEASLHQAPPPDIMVNEPEVIRDPPKAFNFRGLSSLASRRRAPVGSAAAIG